RGTMDEVSSLGLLYRSHHSDQDARQIGPLHSTDPMLGGPKSRSRREAAPRMTSNAGASESSKALDLNAPNREEPILHADSQFYVGFRRNSVLEVDILVPAGPLIQFCNSGTNFFFIHIMAASSRRGQGNVRRFLRVFGLGKGCELLLLRF
ncbi:hypothetical protein, partial [Hyphomonas sp.]|uniref:hypothetical protein n=1 Tax=Alphaproteobacteria TaxID=28211 RepID=UPI00326630FF